MRLLKYRVTLPFLMFAGIASAVCAQGSQRSSGSALADTGSITTVTGTVYDSVSQKTLGGAQVQFVSGTNHSKEYTVRADSLGRFRIDSIRSGEYIVGFFHPAVDALGIEPPLRAVTVTAGSPNIVDLSIPGPTRIMAAICGPVAPHDSSGAMAGVVRDAESGLPIAGAKVVVTWLEIVIDKRGLVSQTRRVPVQSSVDGGYFACGLPGADTVLASAELNERHSGLLNAPIPIGGILRRDFTLGDSATAVAFTPDSAISVEARSKTTVLRGFDSLTGTVHGPDGKPMSGARVLVWGTGLETTTRSSGHFDLNGLPSGTFSVEARSLGFEPRLEAVELSAHHPASIDISLKERVHELSRVVVMGKVSRVPPDIAGFLGRVKNGMGHYITANDNALKNAFAISDALRATPGVQVVPSGSFGHVILLRGGCVPSVYLDGIPMADGYETVDDIPPQQVAGIEVYAGASEAPVQYQTNGCGVVLVWTKR